MHLKPQHRNEVVEVTPDGKEAVTVGNMVFPTTGAVNEACVLPFLRPPMDGMFRFSIQVHPDLSVRIRDGGAAPAFTYRVVDRAADPTTGEAVPTVNRAAANGQPAPNGNRPQQASTPTGPTFTAADVGHLQTISTVLGQLADVAMKTQAALKQKFGNVLAPTRPTDVARQTHPQA